MWLITHCGGVYISLRVVSIHCYHFNYQFYSKHIVLILLFNYEYLYRSNLLLFSNSFIIIYMKRNGFWKIHWPIYWNIVKCRQFNWFLTLFLFFAHNSRSSVLALCSVNSSVYNPQQSNLLSGALAFELLAKNIYMSC